MLFLCTQAQKVQALCQCVKLHDLNWVTHLVLKRNDSFSLLKTQECAFLFVFFFIKKVFLTFLKENKTTLIWA